MFIYLLITYGDHQTSSKQRKWSIKFKMGAWARTGIWCHTVNMNFIHIYKLLKKIKGTLKQHNVTPSQSHFCEIKLST